MKTLLVRLAMVLVIIIISVSLVTPAFAWTGAYTGWEDFENIYAEYSMFIAYYYRDNTPEDVELGYAYVYIDNWGTHPYGVIAILKNWVDCESVQEQTASLTPYIQPGEYRIETISIGYDTCPKEPGDFVLSRTRTLENDYDVWWGQWQVVWWEDMSITMESTDPH